MNLLRTKGGFTLLELLVVIAIIGLFSVVVVTGLADSRKKGKFAQSTMHIDETMKALDLYNLDNNGWPPLGGTALYSTSPTFNNWNLLENHVSPYIKSLPKPLFPSASGGGYTLSGYSYYKGTNASPYHLKINNSKTGGFASCIHIYDGFALFYVMPEQTTLTLNDGGGDPDSIERMRGDVRITYNPSDC